LFCATQTPLKQEKLAFSLLKKVNAVAVGGDGIFVVIAQFMLNYIENIIFTVFCLIILRNCNIILTGGYIIRLLNKYTIRYHKKKRRLNIL
jgi:hypothetical protein